MMPTLPSLHAVVTTTSGATNDDKIVFNTIIWFSVDYVIDDDDAGEWHAR